MKIINNTKTTILQRYLQGTESPSNLYLGIYRNITEPLSSAVIADLSEPISNGYARITLAKANWTFTSNLAVQPQVYFLCVSEAWGNIYGYFICDSDSGTSGNLYLVSHFIEGPYNAIPAGKIYITPKMKIA